VILCDTSLICLENRGNARTERLPFLGDAIAQPEIFY